jgi:hypothetical protein
MNFLTEMLAKCSGAHIPTLEKCPTQAGKYASVGITIIFTGIFAAFSGGYAFYKVFNKEVVNSLGETENTFFYGAILMGLLWGFMIFNLDRFIVMSMRKQNEFWRELVTATPRIVLAIIISLVVAKPLEVRLFQDRITAQISDNELEKREQNRNRIFGITNKPQIDSLKGSSELNISEIRTQLQQDCPRQECNDAYNAQNAELEKFYTIKEQVQTLINDADRNIQFINNSDKYKIIAIVDGVQKKELTTEGRNLLARYRGVFNTNIQKRKTQYAKYQSALSTYNALNKRYKENKKEELAEAENKDKGIAARKAEADSLAAVLVKKSGDATTIAYTNNFITQIEALGDLTKWRYDKLDENGSIIEGVNNTMWYMNLAIILLFIVIETAPVFVKLISNKGQYDIALEADDTKKEAEFIHEANIDISIAEQKSQLKLQALMNNQQAQLGMLQTAIQSWQNQKTRDLNNGTLSDAEYKKIIQEILEFDILTNRNFGNPKPNKNNMVIQLINNVLRRKTTGHNNVQNGNTP